MMLKRGASQSKERKCDTPKTIVRELKSKDLARKTRAASAANSMLHESNASKTAMIKARVIAPLIKALNRHECPELQSEALSALSFIAFVTNDHTMAVIKSGVIPKLLALLSHGSELIEQAVLALGNFVLHRPEIRDTMLASGAVSAMLPYLHPDTPIRQLRSIVRTYSLLCSHDDEQTNLKHLSPALPYIFELLHIKDEEPTEIEDEKSIETEDIESPPLAIDVVEDACTALANIMHGPDDCIDAVQDVVGLTARLVELLGHEATSVQEAALSAVVNMLGGTHAQVDRCIEANCLDHIVSLLQCSEPSLMQEAARAAGNILAGTRAQIQRALEKNILTPLRSILTSKDSECRKQAMYAVTCLCHNGSAAQHEQLVSSGVLEPYCALLAGPERAVVVEVLDSLDVLLQAVERYGNVKPLCYILDELDVLDQIQQLQEHTIDEDYRSKITKIVTLLCNYAREERPIVLEGKMFTLAEIVQDLTSQNLATKTSAACAAHCMLCEENPPINAISKPSIIKPLVKALDGDLSSDLQLAALQVIAKTTSGRHKHRMAVVDSGAVPKLIALLVHGDKISELAACSLGDLALHGSETRQAVLAYTRSETTLTELRAYVRTYGSLCREKPMVKVEHTLRALPFVSELLYIEDREILEQACFAFTSLICSMHHHGTERVQAVPGLTAHLVDLLAYKTPRVPEAALMAVSNMLNGTDDQVDSCLEAGCLDHVISFLQSSEPIMMKLAGAAVTNILRHNYSHIQRTLEKGVLTALRNILAHGEPKCQKQAAIAIQKLCRNGSAAQLYQLEPSGILEPFCALLTGPDLTVTKHVVYALLTLLQAAKKEGKEKLLCTKLDKIGVIEQLQLVLKEQSIDEGLRVGAVEVSIFLRRHAREEALTVSQGTPKVLTVAEIVQDLKSQELMTQRAAACAAFRMFCKQESSRSAAIQAGIIGPLVEALGRDDCETLQLYAINAVLMIVDGTHKHRVALVNSGAIKKIVTLLSKSEMTAKLAAQVLRRITHRSPETRDQVLANGAVQAMLLLMRPDTPLELLRECVQAFRNWCSIPIVSVSMFNIMLPALPYICELLDSGDQDVLANACAAVAHLICMDDRIEPIQAVPGLTERLVALLGHESNKVKEAALGAIANMCTGTDVQANRCLDAGCLEYIVPILQCCEPGRAHYPHLRPDPLEAVGAAQNLLLHTYQIQRVLDKGILTPLLNVLRDSEPDSYLEFHAVCALANIAMRGTREHRLAIVDGGAISLLVTSLSHGAAVVEAAARALGHIVQEIPETGDLVLGLGAVQAMLPHMLPDTPPALLKSCVMIYCCLCQANTFVPNMSKVNRVLPALPYIKKLLDIEDIEVLKFILGALSGLMYDSYERTEAVQATPGLTARVVSLLGHHNTDVKKAALFTVIVMFFGSDIQIARCIDAGCLDHILSLLQSNEHSLVEYAVMATSTMLGQSPSQIQRVLDKGILPPMVHILAEAKPKSLRQYRAIDVFIYISEYGTREQRMAVVHSGAIPKLVAILSQGSEETRKVSYVLVNMARDLPEACEVMLEHGVVPAMLPFMHAGSPSDLLKNCVVTFEIICRHDDTKPSDKLQRVSPALPTISELLNIGDKEVVTWVSFSLVNLMKTNDGIEAVQAVPGLTARLLALVGHDATEVKNVSITAVMLMLSGTDAQMYRCFDANCVDHVISFLRCRDPSLMEEAAEATRSTLGTTHPQLQRALDKDVLTPFMTILACHPEGQKRTVKAITNLCRHGSAAQREQLMSSGVLEPYCALLAGPDRAVVVEVLDSLDVLLQAAEKDGKMKRLRSKLVKIGVFDQVQLLQEDGDEEVKEKAHLLIKAYFPSGSQGAKGCPVS